MRALIVFVVLISVCGVARAGDAPDLAGANVVAHELADRLQSLIDNANSGIYADAESKEYAQRALKLPPDTARTLIFGFFAERVLMSYWDDVLVQLNDMSVKTGRQVKSETVEGDNTIFYHYWLDRGKLDAPECETDYRRRHACVYPDGFEEFELTVKEAKTSDPKRWGLSLDVWRDKREQNKTNFISYSVNMNEKSLNTGVKDMHGVWGAVYIAGHEYDYDKHFANRNYRVNDIRNGMMLRVSKSELGGKGKVPLGVEGWEIDTSKVWKSQDMPPSAEFVEVITVDSLVSHVENKK